MEGRGTPIKELFDELGNCSTGGPILGQLGDLLRGGDLSGQQKPKETLRQWFVTAGCLGKELLAFWNCLSTEANPLVYNTR